ncbi:hypothetical protein OV079_39650 [Nannocystis pusilla]|uniref:DNA ligase D 3'-phosphoesterase domain-containing protein n=1 Tax=Nannocystis pusilla TaxID=889268 RepID=A0A9X3J2Y4_9BACT|nr:DNA polymerase ligase N-terminal domain-containing protein [Nannocystis pusilla]MCY1011578.1 hypothetical protein [Nannocystis pusilla]
MSLARYHRKRDFTVTSEPRGKSPKRRSQGEFIIHKHAARRLHYDIRLELDGVLKSWACPKGPSLDPHDKRLAVHVEDHPLEYGEFEGTIPQGEYGGGSVVLWDRGRWYPEGDARADYRAGKLKFRFDGHKLQGAYTLVRMHGRRDDDHDNWLLIKEDDEEASDDGEALVRDRPESVVSGRTVEEIAAGEPAKKSRARPPTRRPRTSRATSRREASAATSRPSATPPTLRSRRSPGSPRPRRSRPRKIRRTCAPADREEDHQEEVGQEEVRRTRAPDHGQKGDQEEVGQEEDRRTRAPVDDEEDQQENGEQEDRGQEDHQAPARGQEEVRQEAPHLRQEITRAPAPRARRPAAGHPRRKGPGRRRMVPRDQVRRLPPARAPRR